MIKLELALPEPFDLVSIHRKWDNKWCVCLCIRVRLFEMGQFYSSAEHEDIGEAARLALERCESKMNAAPARHQPPARLEAEGLQAKKTAEDLGL